MEIQQLLEGKFSLDINKIVFRKCTLEWEMRPNITNWDNLTYVYAGEIDYAVQGQLQHLQAGDLVFFNSGGNSRICHVGIYCGDGTYVHSTDGAAYGVTVTDLNSGYSARTYVTARRVLR